MEAITGITNKESFDYFKEEFRISLDKINDTLAKYKVSDVGSCLMFFIVENKVSVIYSNELLKSVLKDID